MILLVSNSQDITTDFVVAELRRRGQAFHRFNTDEADHAGPTFRLDETGPAWSLVVNGVPVNATAFRSAYFRRPAFPTSSGVAAAAFLEHLKGEWATFLGSFYASLNSRWLNSPQSIAAAEDKPRQLSVAHGLGFRVPRTLVSNRHEDVASFSTLEPIVAKPVKSGRLTAEGRERIVFTTRIDGVTTEDAPAIALSPVIYQHEIRRRCDLRVTVVDDRVFACRIHQLREQDVDWRRNEVADLGYEIVALPSDLQERCIALVRKLNLRFGAIDLIEDTGGDFWFLEINPNGQWAWIERQAGLPISAAIADALTGDAGK